MDDPEQNQTALRPKESFQESETSPSEESFASLLNLSNFNFL